MSVAGYKAGDHWKICDVCGIRYRASETFKRWDNLMVCAEDYEERHPQDFVRGRTDRQNVPDARPDPVAVIIGPLTTTVSATAAAGATTISVESSTRFLAADHIGVALDNGTVFRVVIQSIPNATSILLTNPLPGSTSSGLAVVNYSSVSSPSL